MAEADEQNWDRGWEAHERQQSRRLAELSLYEKVLWLEQAQTVVDHLEKQRQQQESHQKAKR